MKCGILLTYPLTPFPIKVNFEEDDCVNHITNKNINSKERRDIIFSILNLLATQRSMNTAVLGDPLGNMEQAQNLLVPFEEFRDHQPQLLHEVLGVTGR